MKKMKYTLTRTLVVLSAFGLACLWGSASLHSRPRQERFVDAKPFSIQDDATISRRDWRAQRAYESIEGDKESAHKKATTDAALWVKGTSKAVPASLHRLLLHPEETMLHLLALSPKQRQALSAKGLHKATAAAQQTTTCSSKLPLRTKHQHLTFVKKPALARHNTWSHRRPATSRKRCQLQECTLARLTP